MTKCQRLRMLFHLYNELVNTNAFKVLWATCSNLFYRLQYCVINQWVSVLGLWDSSPDQGLHHRAAVTVPDSCPTNHRHQHEPCVGGVLWWSIEYSTDPGVVVLTESHCVHYVIISEVNNEWYHWAETAALVQGLDECFLAHSAFTESTSCAINHVISIGGGVLLVIVFCFLWYLSWLIFFSIFFVDFL